MFRLVKFLGGRTNEAERRKITVTAIEDDIEHGTPLIVMEGEAMPISLMTTDLPTHLLEADAKAGDTELTVSEILPGMIFETALTAPVANPLLLYGEYPVKGSLLNGGALVSLDVRGALCYDPMGAKKAGDKLLVTFPRV